MRALAKTGGPDRAWWNDLSETEQRRYIAEHPHSKYAGFRRGVAPADPSHPELTDDGDDGQPRGRRSAPPAAAENRTPQPSQGLQPAHEDRAQWPEHIRRLKLPPAWTDVRINHDQHANLMAIGRDQKGRSQYVYSARFSESQAAMKFARIHEMDAKHDEIQGQNDVSALSRDPVVRDHGDCTALVMKMGVRPGSDDDTGAQVKAYGATTLEGRHVVERDGQTRLQFVGKKGISLDLPVEDPRLAKMLTERARKAGESGRLFAHVDSSSLLNYVHSLDGGGFKTKDMRTLHGTRSAHALVASLAVPRDEAEYKRAVRQVAVHVSSRLGNTPAVALQSYISPVVFAPWQAAISKSVEPVQDEAAPAAETAGIKDSVERVRSLLRNGTLRSWMFTVHQWFEARTPSQNVAAVAKRLRKFATVYDPGKVGDVYRAESWLLGGVRKEADARLGMTKFNKRAIPTSWSRSQAAVEKWGRMINVDERWTIIIYKLPRTFSRRILMTHETAMKFFADVERCTAETLGIDEADMKRARQSLNFMVKATGRPFITKQQEVVCIDVPKVLIHATPNRKQNRETASDDSKHMLPDVHFGPPANPRPDWRAKPDLTPDDDEAGDTPRSVKHLLGFDPLEVASAHHSVVGPRRPEQAARDTRLFPSRRANLVSPRRGPGDDHPVPRGPSADIKPPQSPGEWWERSTPMERHAYLDAHPNSKHAGERPAERPPVKTREDYHLSGAAFHRGAAVAHDEAARPMSPDERQLRRGVAGSHLLAQRAHESALDGLRDHRQRKTPETLRTYQGRLEQLGAHLKGLDGAHERRGLPTGVGHTRYVARETKP